MTTAPDPLARRIQWLEFLAEQVPDGSELLAAGCSSIVDALRDPTVVDDVIHLFETHLEEPGRDTWEQLRTSLEEPLGIDGAFYLTWAVRRTPDQRAEAQEPPQVVGLVQRMRRRDLAALESAFEVWQEDPDNWRLFNRRVYRDLFTEQERIEVTILKYGGEEVSLAGPPVSFLRLAVQVLRTVGRTSPDEWGSDPDAVAELGSLADLLRRAIEPPPDDAPAEAPES